jgi:hypothetical protein
MADRPRLRMSDADLETALRGLGDAIAWPASGPASGEGPDLAAVIRARIEAGDVPATERRRWWARPARRALVLAVIVVLALAALAGAATLGLPGLRLILGPAPVSPPPSVRPSPSPGAVPGITMGLGTRVDLAGLDERAGFAVRRPTDPLVGPPDAAYHDLSLGGQVALVWSTRPDLPSTLQTGVGAVLTQFRGVVDNGYFQKAISGGTVVEPAKVGDRGAYWVSGDPHFLFYQGPDGQIFEERRWVGDALLWAEGGITYRLETSLGRDRAIEIAESLR